MHNFNGVARFLTTVPLAEVRDTADTSKEY
jgi:hypothetical protein